MSFLQNLLGDLSSPHVLYYIRRIYSCNFNKKFRKFSGKLVFPPKIYKIREKNRQIIRSKIFTYFQFFQVVFISSCDKKLIQEHNSISTIKRTFCSVGGYPCMVHYIIIALCIVFYFRKYFQFGRQL